MAPGLPPIQSDKLRPLGVSAPKRLAQLPAVPPIAETLPGYEMLDHPPDRPAPTVIRAAGHPF